MRSFALVDRPHAPVRRIGSGLSDPYVEWCRSAVVGPSSTLLLLGLSALWVAADGVRPDVHRRVATLALRQRARLREWTRTRHQRRAYAWWALGR